MSCQQIQDQLSAYLDGELPAEEARGVERHLQECAACRDLLEELRAVAQLVSSLPRRRAPEELADEIQSRLERRMLLSPMADQAAAGLQTDRALARERPAVWPRVAAVAASVLLAVGIAWLALAPRPTPTEQTAQLEVAGEKKTEGPALALADESGRRAEYFKSAPAERATFENAAKDRARASTATEAGERAGDLQRQGPVLEERAAFDDAYQKSGPAARAGQSEAKGWVALSTENVLALESPLELAQAEGELKKVLHNLNLNLAPQTEAAAQVAAAPPATSGRARWEQYKPDIYQTTTYVGVASPSQVRQLALDIAGSKVFRVRTEALGGTFAAAQALRKPQVQAAEAAGRDKKDATADEVAKANANAPATTTAARRMATEPAPVYEREAPAGAAPAAESPKSEQAPERAPPAPAGAAAKEGDRGGEGGTPPPAAPGQSPATPGRSPAAQGAADSREARSEAEEQQIVIVIQLAAPRDAAAAGRAAALDAEAAKALREAHDAGRTESKQTAPAQAAPAKE